MRTRAGQGGLPVTRRRGREGMTLVELMIALVVLGVGIMGVALMFPYGNESSIDDRNLTHAIELAQQKMEQLKAKSYIDPDLEPGWHPNGTWESVGPNGHFDRRWAIVPLGGATVVAKYVRVEVTWPQAKPDTVRLVTYIKR